MYNKLIKNTTLVSSGMMVSRVLGFVRDVMLAHFFGTKPLFEAFLVAFRLPNLFRSVFAEGFVDSVATPVFAEQNHDRKELFALGGKLLSFTLVVVTVATFLGIIFSRELVLLIAPGFNSDIEKFNLAVSFTRITFFYLLFIALASDLTAMLSALRKFFVPALNPAFLNIAFIFSLLFLTQIFNDYVLAVAVLIAGVLEIIFPYIFLVRLGFVFKFSWTAFRDSQIIKMLKLFAPRVWASIMYHVNIFIDTILCSFPAIVGAGAIAGMYYANRLIQFPLALIAVALTQVAVVDLSQYHKNNDFVSFKKLLVFALQNMAFFVIPISFIFIFMSQALIEVIFFRGEFDRSALLMTSGILFFYSFGLFFFCVVKIFVTAFYAMKETHQPAKTVTLAILVNFFVSVGLMFPLKAGGVALGSSIAALFNSWLLYHELTKKIGALDWQDTLHQIIKLGFLGIILGLLARLSWDNLILPRYFKIGSIFIMELVLFFLLAKLMKFRQISYLTDLLIKR